MCISRSIISSGHLSHNQSLGVFTVIGTSGNPHAVRIFPSESCTCPSTARCYHILAVRMSVGLEDVSSKRKVNLTQLRRNARGKADKRSGRKAPRPGDYDIISAPDSCSQSKVVTSPSPQVDVKDKVNVGYTSYVIDQLWKL